MVIVVSANAAPADASVSAVAAHSAFFKGIYFFLPNGLFVLREAWGLDKRVSIK